MLQKEIEEDTNKWKYIQYSWIGRINIIKIYILPKPIYRFNVILIKISVMFSTEVEEVFQKCIWNHKSPHIATVILRKNNKVAT